MFMEKMYNATDRFFKSSKKFPRFMNLRRRPIASMGGKLLQSIIEEIAEVEEAIIDYKKDFFLVNYLDKAEEYIDYLYQVEVGDIADLDKLLILAPDLKLTADRKEFYKSPEEYAYYQNGYLVLLEKVESLTYSVDGFSYKVIPSQFHVWNIFHEFAWWVGLERLLKETNRELMHRTINVFRARPSSSETGLKNLIKNTLLNYGHIDDGEIVFEKPDENNMALAADDSKTVYDSLSEFNRDIARNKKWDIDYWQNDFASINYLPHEWDAKVETYKDGVGYNDSLKISTVKDLDSELGTSVTINGYKKSEDKIEEYFRGHNMKKKLKLKLKKYLDIMNPIQVQYKITASSLTSLSHPEKCYVTTFKAKNKKASYPVEKLYISDNGVDIKQNNQLEDGKRYKVELLPNKSFLTEKCRLLDSNGNMVMNLLREYDQFTFNNFGSLINRDQKFYGDSTYDFNHTENLQDTENGFSIINNEENSAFSFETEGSSFTNPNLRMKLEYSCDPVSLMKNPLFIKTNGFVYDGVINKYRLKDGMGDEDYAATVIEFDGNYLEYTLPRAESSSVQINVFINGEKSISYSYATLNLSKAMKKPEPIYINEYGHIRVEIIRLKGSPSIENILAKRYSIEVRADGELLTAQTNGSYVLPRKDKVDVDVTIKNYGKTDFEIKSVIVGKELTKNNSTYESLEFMAGQGYSLDISHSGETKVFDIDAGQYIEFYPYNSYVNNAQDQANRDIYLDLSRFSNIVYSNPTIKKSGNGNTYITLDAGESIRDIEIYGAYKETVSRKSLSDIIGVEAKDTIKVNNRLKSLVLADDKAVKITRDLVVNQSSNIITVELDEEDRKRCGVIFVSDSERSIEKITDIYKGAFSFFYIYDKNSIDYISYNTENVVQELSRESANGESIKINNNFTPYIPEDKEVVYFLEEGQTTASNIKTNVDFFHKETDGTYSLTNWTSTKLTPIQIKLELDKEDKELIQYEELELEEEFNISNNIELAEAYTINNKTIELDQYIIEAPEKVKIIYEEVTKATSIDEEGYQFYIETDGFNKLPNSNIIDIIEIKVNGNVIDRSKYELIKEAGFVWWKDEALYSKPFSIVYSYRRPKYITFSSLDLLYELAGYKIETLENVNVREYKIDNLKNGDEIELDLGFFAETPEKIAVICSSDAYIASINYYGAKITATINKIAEDNSLVIHNGYYYIDGKEYWYFSDKNEKNVTKADGLSFHNVKKLGEYIGLSKESTNFLKNSRMQRNVLNPTASFDFTHYHSIPNVSSLEHLGACETLGAWHTYNMKLNPSSDYDGDAIIFNNLDESGYALMDITKVIQSNKLISAWINGKLTVALGREVLLNGQPLAKSLYVEKIRDFNYYKDKVYLDCSDCDTENYRYFLIVTGSGALIEMIVADKDRFDRLEDFESDYIKAIDRFGFKIKEKISPGSKLTIDFTPTGMQFNGLEIDKSLTIQPGSNVDWGLTKIKGYNLKSETLKNQFMHRNDSLVAMADNAYIETTPIRLEYIRSIRSLFIKVNDYHIKKLKGFNIQVYASSRADGDYQLIGTAKNTNVASVSGSKLLNYIKFKVMAEENKAITNIEVFANYFETDKDVLRIYDSSYGSCETKIFDLGAEGNYCLDSIVGDAINGQNVRFFIRGVRFDSFDNVYTDWYPKEERHLFCGYRHFQFKIEIKSADAKLKIDKFIMEAV